MKRQSGAKMDPHSQRRQLKRPRHKRVKTMQQTRHPPGYLNGNDGLSFCMNFVQQTQMLDILCRFGVLINGSDVTMKALPHGKEIPAEFRQPSKTCAIYELSATVLQVKSDEKVPHLVAQVRGILQ